ncbi:hypothetical protein LH53_06215 [Mesotoga sp. TolDC]|nr:hypothetical protein LH53_06215 [Mesotoga sp. TolDC]
MTCTHPVDDGTVDTPLERGFRSSLRPLKIRDPYLSSLLSPSLYSLNKWSDQERRKDLRSGKNNGFSSANGEPISVVLPTSDPVPPTPVLVLPSYNSQLVTCN